ncbi:MAG: sigma-70 family RNA polymerase sigma factor [Phycisphaerae bacterium]|nr:sigma-70 family RNA polymerase sigma factor [Phycisphaerae bacterium]
MSVSPNHHPAPPNLPTAELESVRAAIDGRPGAFDLLIAGYADRLRGLIRRRLDPALRARLSADDVVQETLLVASDRVRDMTVTREGDFWAWLCSIAEQRLIDARRRHLLTAKRDVRRATPLATDAGVGDALLRFCPPSEDARANERSRGLDRALAELPASYREVIRLRIIEGLSTMDAAAVMERTPGALSVLLCKAVRRLGEVLNSDEAGGH